MNLDYDLQKSISNTENPRLSVIEKSIGMFLIKYVVFNISELLDFIKFLEFVSMRVSSKYSYTRFIENIYYRR